MNYAQHFFIGSQYHGTAKRNYFDFHRDLFEGHPRDVQSTAWFCRTCGEVWARAVLEPTHGGDTYPYAIEFHGCERHPTALQRTPPGSIRSWYTNWLPYLPDDMVRYEFHQLMKFLDESDNNE